MEVIIHPLVLLSVVDHYNRIAKDTRKRVVGVLLGSRTKDRIDITNSFAVPFEEDLNNPNVWFLDHNFLESMYWMFKKVTTREEIQGFYSTGPKIKENDLKINSVLERFCTGTPVFSIIDVRPGVEGVPITTYQAVDEVEAEGKEIRKVFKHVVCNIEAEEAEAVGVEHLLRDINDPSTSHLALQIKQKVNGLKGLLTRLNEMKVYLERVSSGKLPINNQIIYNIQNILNYLPNLNLEVLVNAILQKTNDMHLIMYVCSLVRSILALHDLLNNKIKYRDFDAIMDKEVTLDAAGKEKKDTTTAANGDSNKDANSESKGEKSPKK